MVDFEKYRTVSMQEILKTGGNAHGGLTVRDYFAAQAMQGLLIRGRSGFEDKVSFDAYVYADAMMKERNKPVQQPTPSVEEAFGLDK